MQTRRSFLLALAAAAALPLTACVTRNLLASNRQRQSNEIDSILLSADEKNLVVITGGYHYLFPAPPAMLATLKQDFHRYATASFSDFHVDDEGTTMGEVRLQLQEAPEAASRAAALAGYRDSAGGMSATCAVKGRRYQAGAIAPSQQYQLNRAYRIYIDAPASAGERGGKLMLTPITLALDGALILFGVPLLILALSLKCNDKQCF